MIGLILLTCIALYLALSVGVIVLVGKWAKKRGRRRWPWCMVAGIVMYLLVAWEQIPTYVVGKYYCATQAGLTVYKTPEKWLSENLWATKGDGTQYLPSVKVGEYGTDYSLNNIFVWSVRRHPLEYLPVTISIQSILDGRNNELLVEHVSVVTGYYRWQGYKGIKEYKFWVGGARCESDYYKFIDLRQAFRKIMEDE